MLDATKSGGADAMHKGLTGTVAVRITALREKVWFTPYTIVYYQ
jgi:hypothetical protein